ncbi:hypothetical protein LTR16_003337, partial [Cryomyces antarcticus]
LDLTFPLPTHATARATLHIRPNADVAVAAEPFVPRRARDDGGGAGVGMGGAHGDGHKGDAGVVGDEAREAEAEARRLARALDVAADLNVWVEWVGRRHASE